MLGGLVESRLALRCLDGRLALALLVGVLVAVHHPPETRLARAHLRLERPVHRQARLPVLRAHPDRLRLRAAPRRVRVDVAAAQPLAVDRDGIAADVIDRERGIFLEQAKYEGKPENIAEKIVQGRVEKFFQENCLMEQAFVKNPDQTIEQLITDLTAKIGEKIGVRRFSCFRLGEE